MSWQYRPCKIVAEDGTEHWDIRSFHTRENGDTYWSAQSSYPFGETLEELKLDLGRMAIDLERREPLVLYVYTCVGCKQQDARTEKGRTMCECCLAKQKPA